MKIKNKHGITLIALVITIIVLLILAGVAVSIGLNGGDVFNRANQAKAGWNAKVAEGDQKLSEAWNILNSIEADTNNLDALTIGTAINTEKYGWLVPEYTKCIDETGGWRLFYQDKDYTYIISDELIGRYKITDYYSGYMNGLAVGTIGQKLNPTVSELFTEENTDNTIKATAWLTDDQFWNKYVGNDAIFAIGSPTVELFVESYNNTGKPNTITFEKSSHGYSCNVGANWLNPSDNYGIYNKEQTSSSTWWLASPCDIYNPYTQEYKDCWTVYGYNGFFSSGDVTYAWGVPVRPLVCIPTSAFSAKYTLVDE